MTESAADQPVDLEDDGAPKSFMANLMSQVRGLLEDDERDYEGSPDAAVGHSAVKAGGQDS
jgi:hypothetical protein